MFTIVTLPAKSLRQPSRELSVDEISQPEFQRYLDELGATMVAADGVGIASPQVGRNIRAMAIAGLHGPEFYINPVMTKKSAAMTDSEEGCLSVPGKYGIVERHKKISVKALNRHGRRVSLEVKHFPAIVFQHEIDHLDGILFIDKAKKIVNTVVKHI